jgi:hypothetical protein
MFKKRHSCSGCVGFDTALFEPAISVSGVYQHLISIITLTESITNPRTLSIASLMVSKSWDSRGVLFGRLVQGMLYHTAEGKEL